MIGANRQKAARDARLTVERSSECLISKTCAQKIEIYLKQSQASTMSFDTRGNARIQTIYVFEINKIKFIAETQNRCIIPERHVRDKCERVDSSIAAKLAPFRLFLFRLGNLNGKHLL